MENDEEKTDLMDHLHTTNLTSEINKFFLAVRDPYKALGVITLYAEKHNYSLNVQENITPKEVSDLMIMFLLSLHAHEKYDWDYIIEDKKLTRHFDISNNKS